MKIVKEILEKLSDEEGNRFEDEVEEVTKMVHYEAEKKFCP